MIRQFFRIVSRFCTTVENSYTFIVSENIISVCWDCSYNQRKQLAIFWHFQNGPRQANLVLSHMRAAKVQASLRIRAVLPEPPLLAHTSNESRGTFRQKARSLAPLNGWACAVTICHDGMLEDTNSLDGAQITTVFLPFSEVINIVLVLHSNVFFWFIWRCRSNMIIYEPRHEKTCLQGLRPGKTNWPAQPQKLARVLKFHL